jgi:hypothetical protein
MKDRPGAVGPRVRERPGSGSDASSPGVRRDQVRGPTRQTVESDTCRFRIRRVIPRSPTRSSRGSDASDRGVRRDQALDPTRHTVECDAIKLGIRCDQVRDLTRHALESDAIKFGVRRDQARDFDASCTRVRRDGGRGLRPPIRVCQRPRSSSWGFMARPCTGCMSRAEALNPEGRHRRGAVGSRGEGSRGRGPCRAS